MSWRAPHIFAVLYALLGSLSAYADTQDIHRRAHTETRVTTNNLEDIKAEIRFGREVAARILGREHLLDHAGLTRYVSLVGNALVEVSPRQDLTFYFAILDSDVVNAYSTPGGYVFVTRGALKQMRDESELAGVLAHEIAHIAQRHIVHALRIRASTNDVTSRMSIVFSRASDSASVMFQQGVDKATELLFARGYDIQDEFDADRVATTLLANAGYDATALHRFLERVDHDAPSAAPRTHPNSSERMAALINHVQDNALATPTQLRNQSRFSRHASAL